MGVGRRQRIDSAPKATIATNQDRRLRAGPGLQIRAYAASMSSASYAAAPLRGRCCQHRAISVGEAHPRQGTRREDILKRRIPGCARRGGGARVEGAAAATRGASARRVARAARRDGGRAWSAARRVRAVARLCERRGVIGSRRASAGRRGGARFVAPEAGRAGARGASLGPGLPRGSRRRPWGAGHQPLVQFSLSVCLCEWRTSASVVAKVLQLTLGVFWWRRDWRGTKSMSDGDSGLSGS